MASDVVDIEGVPTDLTFAMQMSYDDRINTALDGPETIVNSRRLLSRQVVNGIMGERGFRRFSVAGNRTPKPRFAGSLTLS